MSLAGKTLFITGASRGIGLAIGLRAAQRRRQHRDRRQDHRAASKARRDDLHRGGGGRACRRQGAAARVDIRDEAAVKKAVARTAEEFGGIDIVVNNASAISLTDTRATEMKRFDLMHQINTRGTFVVTKHALPFLEKAAEPACAYALSAARHERAVVRTAFRLQPRQIRDEPLRAGVCRRVPRTGHRGQCALAAHDDRDCRD